MINPNNAVLLVKCPERKGVVAALANFIYAHNGDILHAEEHQDPLLKLFMMRVEWGMEGFTLPLDGAFAAEFKELFDEFHMEWKVALTNHRPRVAIMVSKSGHCLADLLYRHQIGELNCEIPVVVSNHDDQRKLAEFYERKYHHVPVIKGDKANKDDAERQVLALLEREKIDLVVLARYMQILSQDFIHRYPNKIINIHHSFLPAFVGAKPYHRSFERGTKIVGATAHYVTEVLDEGPIIDQDIVRITHRDTLEDMIRKGGDVERVVLSRAVRWHVENRVVVYGNKTAVFA
ncbi:MAG: formyltetrahydrofolate deformylase [Terriglobales bacterium]